MPAKNYSGTCACGEVSISASNSIGNNCYCHCESCRQASGAPFLAWTSFPNDLVEISGNSFSIHRSSPNIERGFCASCGTTISYRNLTLTNEIDLCTALLVDAEDLAPVAHIWLSDKLPWVQLNDGLPGYDEWRKPS